VERLGGYCELVVKTEDINTPRERALASDKPALLNVVVERAISPRAEAAIGRRKAAAKK
jgi:thiamine pyrophosphate-dependent acetolactate synthase large subunit-like protein